ncbi:hypothetical protein NQ176_g7881 [Zarea fungicola]|uniref:Uncharacterized protein n=1 Tax=Zarea fungicola TaxID=93591 RepID=A0ACC1MWD5_9HYPO|nr:hypothetical protein NQ176_g7881 [Lecanicillium fungicola]
MTNAPEPSAGPASDAKKPTTTDNEVPRCGIDATEASRSPGSILESIIQAPLNVPINAFGNTVNVTGAGNPVFANSGTESDDL